MVHLYRVVGRWPEKSVKFITRLLKNAESNADAKNLELENLVIKNIVVQQAPVCPCSNSASPKFTYLNNRKPAVVHTVLTVALTPTRATLVMLKSSLWQLKKRWSEAKIRRLQHLHLLVSTGDKLQGGVSRPRAFDSLRFRMCAGVNVVPSCQPLCTGIVWCETLIPERAAHPADPCHATIPVHQLGLFPGFGQGLVRRHPVFPDRQLYSYRYT